MKLVILTIGLVSINNDCSAKKVDGYIINENQDTIYGKIRLPWINTSTGAVVLFGFDFESLFRSVSFKGKAGKSYHTFRPNTIYGFGFNYKSSDYFFRSMFLNYKSLFKKEGQEYRFLNLIHHGKVDLYQNIIFIKVPVNYPSSPDERVRSVKIYEYYIWSEPTKLLWVGEDKQNKSIWDLLRKCCLEKEYIQTMPENANFKDIKLLLENYDKWVSGKPEE